jgi:hypothetical protein
MKIRLLILCSALAVATSTSFAQTGDSSNAPPPGTAAQRKKNQQDRIANGIDSGKLTAGETKNLEKRQANINQNERGMRAADNGKLTGADRTKLNNEQNRASQRIYEDKHNDKNATYGNNEVGQRRENQQDRIAQGIRSGQMTPGGATKQEGREQNLNRQIGSDRKANGGPLTAGERKGINQQQNKQSQQIYNEKHNDTTGH